MKSIRTRILSLTIMAVLVSMLAVGTICLASLRTESDRSSTEAMRIICDERCRTINDYLDKIELSLDIVSQFAVSDLDTDKLAAGGVIGVDGWGGHVVQRDDALAQQSALDAYLHGYSAQVESVLLSAANRNDGIVTFYYRINPEISMDEKGFLYSRIGGGEFEKMESYAVVYAANHASDPKPFPIIVKSVCDFADSEKSDDYQRFAAYSSCEFAKFLYEKILPMGEGETQA